MAFLFVINPTTLWDWIGGKHMSKPYLLRLNLQYFAEETPSAPESNDWSSFLSEQLTETVDDQPEVESEVEEVSKDTVTDDEVEPDSDEQQEETEETEETEEKPAFDDDTLIDLGDGTQPIPLKELKAGNLRQADYTKKTQALAAERTEFESEKAELEPVRGWLDYINSNPYLMQRVNEAISTWNNLGEIPPLEEVLDTEAGPYINHLITENNRIQSELDRINGEYQNTKFDSDMNTLVTDLKAEYGDLITPEYEQQLKDQAQQEGLSTDVLKRIAKGDLAEQKLQQTQKDSKKVEAKTKQKIRETKLPPQPKKVAQQPVKEVTGVANGWGDFFRSLQN